MFAEQSISNPIFLLGTGRCGSTAQQVFLSNLSDVWIWGEHAGILGGILKWAREARSVPQLQEYVLSRPATDVLSTFNLPLEYRRSEVAWLNGFRDDDLRNVERSTIEYLMSRNLPPGKSRWGFKEILYGVDRSPERLLELFPKAKIVHTVRHPFRTVESMISEWWMPQLRAAVDESDYQAVDAMYYSFLRSWLQTTSYFLDLEAQQPDRVITSRLETFNRDREKLLAFLEIEASGPVELEHVYAGVQIAARENLDYVAALKARRRTFVSQVRDVAMAIGYDFRDHY